MSRPSALPVLPCLLLLVAVTQPAFAQDPPDQEPPVIIEINWDVYYRIWADWLGIGLASDSAPDDADALAAESSLLAYSDSLLSPRYFSWGVSQAVCRTSQDGTYPWDIWYFCPNQIPRGGALADVDAITGYGHGWYTMTGSNITYDPVCQVMYAGNWATLGGVGKGPGAVLIGTCPGDVCGQYNQNYALWDGHPVEVKIWPGTDGSYQPIPVRGHGWALSSILLDVAY